jgi:hypothetical protein
VCYKGESAEIGLSLCSDRAEIVLRMGGAIREEGRRRGGTLAEGDELPD